MDLLYIFLLFIIFALAMWAWKLQCEKVEADAEARLAGKERDEYAELGKGLAEYNQKLQEKKDLAKSKILEMFDKKEKVTSQEASKALGISNVSARRYIDELEHEGKLKQTGVSGKKVFYSKV